MEKMYDLGDLKNEPDKLYDMAIGFNYVFGDCPPLGRKGEIWEVLACIQNTLWNNLPPVVTIDFRDPDDPNTWGEFGPPPECLDTKSADDIANGSDAV